MVRGLLCGLVYSNRCVDHQQGALNVLAMGHFTSTRLEYRPNHSRKPVFTVPANYKIVLTLLRTVILEHV